MPDGLGNTVFICSLLLHWGLTGVSFGPTGPIFQCWRSLYPTSARASFSGGSSRQFKGKGFLSEIPDHFSWEKCCISTQLAYIFQGHAQRSHISCSNREGARNIPSRANDPRDQDSNTNWCQKPNIQPPVRLPVLSLMRTLALLPPAQPRSAPWSTRRPQKP
jgi:hypothetical protein